MAEERSFRDYCLVACAILHPELTRLQEEGERPSPSLSDRD